MSNPGVGSSGSSSSVSSLIIDKSTICNSTNQVYDAQFRTCVSCSDPTVSPLILPDTSASVSNGTTGNNLPNTTYQCNNKPIITYNSNISSTIAATPISYTCNQGESLVWDNLHHLRYSSDTPTIPSSDRLDPQQPVCRIIFTARGNGK